MAQPNKANGQGMGEGRGRATVRKRVNSRRALRDIRNRAVPIRGGDAPKNGLESERQSGTLQNLAPARRPETRKCKHTFANNHYLTQVDGEHDENCEERQKQRKFLSKHPRHEVSEAAHPMQVCRGTNKLMPRFPTALLKKENESLARKDKNTTIICGVESEAEGTFVPNIDEDDEGNPMFVTEYVQDIYSYYHHVEIMSGIQPDYMVHQSEVNDKMRSILIDWLIEVHHKFDLRHETLFLTVNIIDRFLSIQNVARNNLQLVGVSTMLLACKYEEIYFPIPEDFVIICDGACTRDEVLEMERSIARALQFKFTLPTPYVFMERFLKAAGSDMELEEATFFFIELSLVEYEMLRYSPSMLAAAAIYTARCTLKRHPSWDSTLQCCTNYVEASLQECAMLMVDLHENSGQDMINFVFRKYSNVARLQPALFIKNR